MTTSNGRSGEGRRAQRSAGQWLIGLLIVLALAASVLMVINDDMSLAGSLAVIAALWAAVIAAILVTKFRRQAEGAEAKSRDLRLVYELQLEREIAARRQYELDVESTIRREVADEANHELVDLKHQIASLRASLEVLLGGPLPDQGIALGNERVRQLGAGFGGHMPDDLRAAQDFAATAPARQDARSSTANADPNEMTEVIPVVTDDEPLSGEFEAVDYPAYGSSDGGQTGPHQAYSQVQDQEGYPREFNPVAYAQQNYGQQDRPQPETGRQEAASQDWGAYVANRAAADQPSDLETTTVFNRRDLDESSHDPAATTQIAFVESGRDYEDIGEHAPRQEPEPFDPDVDDAESYDDPDAYDDPASYDTDDAEDAAGTPDEAEAAAADAPETPDVPEAPDVPETPVDVETQHSGAHERADDEEPVIGEQPELAVFSMSRGSPVPGRAPGWPSRRPRTTSLT